MGELRPIGIIRTLPSLYADKENVGRKEFEKSVAGLKDGSTDAIAIALAQQPTQEFLYVYLLVDGEIKVRVNFSHYEPGTARECWDKTIRKPKVWAICTAPLIEPTEPMKRRGFQGFRYVYEELF